MTIPLDIPIASLESPSFTSVSGPNLEEGSYVSRHTLNPRDQAILTSLSNFRFMTTKQIESLHFNSLSSARISRKVLERLTANHLIRRLNRRIGGLHAGSSSYIYALTPKGANLISAKPNYSFEPSTLFLDHTLLIMDTYIQVAELFDLKILDFETEPNCWRVIKPGLMLKPDLWLKLGSNKEELHWFVELDRSTEHKTAIKTKLELYYQYFLTGQEQDKADLFPRVLWLVPNNARKSWLEALIRPYEAQIPGLFVASTFANSMLALRSGR